MKRIRTLSALRRAVAAAPRPLALVPTMGALHDGHLALVRKARALVGRGGTVALSLFVNPTQFGPNEDLAKYPRPIARDLALCQAAGVDIVFTPEAGAMYAPDRSVWVEETSLSRGWCGASRPGHFRGVCTVVAKLFLQFQPDLAVFGKKDYQQLAVIRRMVRDLDFPVRVVGVPTVREPDGLALSSRNRYLTPEQRAVAPEFHRVLERVADRLRAGGGRGIAAAKREGVKRLSAIPGCAVEYLEVAHAGSLGVPVPGGPLVIAAAIRLGATRLIDNVEVR